MSEIMPNMTVLFEAEALSQEWPVVVICGKGKFCAVALCCYPSIKPGL